MMPRDLPPSSTCGAPCPLKQFVEACSTQSLVETEATARIALLKSRAAPSMTKVVEYRLFACWLATCWRFANKSVGGPRGHLLCQPAPRAPRLPGFAISAVRGAYPGCPPATTPGLRRKHSCPGCASPGRLLGCRLPGRWPPPIKRRLHSSNGLDRSPHVGLFMSTRRRAHAPQLS